MYLGQGTLAIPLSLELILADRALVHFFGDFAARRSPATFQSRLHFLMSEQFPCEHGTIIQDKGCMSRARVVYKRVHIAGPGFQGYDSYVARPAQPAWTRSGPQAGFFSVFIINRAQHVAVRARANEAARELLRCRPLRIMRRSKTQT
jgi:hypothetical protein